MECYGFDIHSPFLFICGAGFFIGTAVSSFVRSFFMDREKRSRAIAGVYFSLSAFFTVLLLALFLIDIPSLRYSNTFAVVAAVSVLLGAAAASWKRTVGGTLLVLVLAVITLFSLYARQWNCVEEGESILQLRVLSVDKSGIEVEVMDPGEESKENIRIKSIDGGGEISIGYRRTELPEWFFLSKNPYLYRLEVIGPSVDNKSGSEVSILERIVGSFPFVGITKEEVIIADPEELSRYKLIADHGELTAVTSRRF
ncbi:MAG: hypothetical protein R6V67_09865 [Spirochaetia bacterium]